MQVMWSVEKNSILKETRKVCFEDVENAIMNDNILDIIPHHNQEKYAHQELMIVSIQNYTRVVSIIKNIVRSNLCIVKKNWKY
jgi:hypothetical protein